ncbi:MAG: gliding motility-associated protein GldE [Bacteroidia bacterium]|nr:gliding motility-associated protein GldE [Bacteroidia bacterium]MDW8301947.1 gliding motility-associated protein GldE [Bacteroidia bacterium]
MDAEDPVSCFLNIILDFVAFGFEDAITVIAILLLLFFSSLISGSEVAFFSLTHEQVESFKSSKSRRENKIYRLLSKPKELIATLLILNNFINIIIVILVAVLAEKYLVGYLNLSQWELFAVETVSTTLVIIFVAEVTPKVYASQRNVQFAKNTVYILEYGQKIFKPFVYALVAGTNWFEKLKDKQKQKEIDTQELINAIELTSDHDTPIEEKKILKGIVNFGNIVARQIMTPRLNIVALPIDAPFSKVLQNIRENRYSRIPVYRDKDRREDIVGILYVKDILPFINEKDNFAWQNLLREPYFIPETKKIDDLFYEFKQKHVHLAIVVDEYGVVVGLVTMEDVIEEIVGEIHDEAEEIENFYTKVNDTTYLFDAKTSLTDFCKVLNLDPEIFNQIKGETETLGGLILEQHGRMPAKNHQFTFSNLKFIVDAVSKRRIVRIKVIVLQTAPIQET